MAMLQRKRILIVEHDVMNVLLIGGTGLIGRKVTDRLRHAGHEARAASRSLGVNTVTGEGLDDALAGVQVVVDVTNSSEFADQAVMEFFQTSGRNLLAAGQRAGVSHHVVLSVVGTDRLQQSGYFRAKWEQEEMVRRSGLPYSIVRSTQFYEFLDAIAAASVSGDTIQLAPVAFQPIAASDAADFLMEIITGDPLNGMIEIAGPERSYLTELIERYFSIKNDSRKVMANREARYFGARVNDQSLVPGPDARIGTMDLKTWDALERLGIKEHL